MIFSFHKKLKKEILKYHSYIIWPCLMFMMIYYSLEIIKYEFHVFKTGDWLINYDYGFIRRGLIGSFFNIIVKYFNLSSSELVWMIFIVQNIFYILIFYFVQKIYLQNKKNYFNLILFLSPAYILFPYYDFAGGYRKEIITFLSFVILSYSYCKEIKSTKVIWASLILYIIALFSHEATIFVLPFFIFILLKIKKSKLLSFKKTYTFIVIFIATTLISIILSYLSSINSEKNIIIVNSTCKYLISIGFDNKICESAFIFIARTFKENLLEVTDSIYPRLTISFLLFFLSILPVFFSNWIENKENKIITIFGIIFILPLFFLAHDFGRWIHIFIFCLFTIILVDKNKYSKKKIPIFFLAGYLLLWSVPHYGNVPVGDGFLLKQINLIKLYQNEKYK